MSIASKPRLHLAGRMYSPTRDARSMSSLGSAVELSGRALLMILFMMSGVAKATGYAATAAYMASMGVPAILLPLAIVTELVGGLAIVVGWRTRIAAGLLTGYALLTGVLFHANFDNQIELVMFLKNLSIAGGLLLLVANGAGPYSLDARIRS